MCGACAEGSSSSTCHACSHPNTALYHVAQGKCCRVPLPRRKNWLFQYRTAVAGRTSSESSRCVPWWMYSVFPSLINGSKNSLTFRIESLKGWALSQCGQRRQDPQSRVAVPRRKEPWLPPCGFRSATWARAPSALGEELPLGVWVICLQCRNSESFAYDFNLSNSRACPYAWVWLEPPERAGQLGWAGPLRAGGSHCLGTGRGLGQWRLQDTPGLAASGGCQGKADVGGCSLPSQAAGQEGAPGSGQAEGPRPLACGAAGDGEAVPCSLGPTAARCPLALPPEAMWTFCPISATSRGRTEILESLQNWRKPVKLVVLQVDQSCPPSSSTAGATAVWA